VLDDGATRLAIVVCDSCAVDRTVVVEAKARIREQTGLEPETVLISATAHPLGPGGDGGVPERPGPAVSALPRRPGSPTGSAARSTTCAGAIAGAWGRDAAQVFNRRGA
jgi:hypothetical protein